MTLPQLPISTPAALLYGIVAAAALIYLPFFLVAAGRVQVGFQAFETPRALVDKLPIYAQRATWAHQNAFEAFMLFTAAALMTYMTQVTSPSAAWAAIAFVIARTFYPLFYVLNFVPGRSLMFATGSFSIFTLFILSLKQLG
ncbi:MAPEG family protein [Phormidium sp. CLA17]|uniref:MAPEG family protein n=1 Tax=Leptolyngbya sp. Cla-17 TaxID=2803751 RepID=UPI001492CA0C|nr:MAPEG family protein [Leptolyngbya sp. Cla-17]MBM0740142.1 MAPEG family protein [Leptolyngbya sp. Cla-17]